MKNALRKTFKQIRRSPYQAVSAVAVLTVTFFITNIFALVAIGSQIILKHFETRPQVIAYLKDEVLVDEVNPLIQNIKSSGVVQEVVYVSKDQAFEIYKESVGNDPLLLGTITDLSLITADILPASIEITVDDPSNFNQVLGILESSDLINLDSEGKKDIDFPQDVITELTAWTNGIRVGGLILIGALALSSILTIMIIISLKIAHRRFEISTMKLLGANKSFISTPYILESMIYSTIGGLLGWFFVYVTVLYATPFLAPRLSGIISLPPNPIFMLEVLGGTIISSLLLGLISGSLAVTRFFKR